MAEELNNQDNENIEQDKSLETKNLQFTAYDIQFAPEDVEKMKHMSLEEENAYILKLKQEGRYVRVYPENNNE